MTTSRIPVSGPWITQKEIAYVTDAVTNAWFGNANAYHERFEAAFADYVGTRHAIALPSCTSALHLALLSLGIGPQDEVVVPEATWIASAAPISYVGATPVFADIDPQSWCLSAASFEQCLTPRTRALILVDLYGNLPDMDGIRAIAARHGIPVIEDAAQAIGARYGQKKAGSFGEVGVFSFHGSKTLTTGEGGMLVTDRSDVYERALFLRDHGRKPGEAMFWNTEIAYKYKMSSMQAALGLAQLERIEELVGRKREIFAWYQAELADVAGLTLNHEARGVFNTYWMVTCLLDPDWGLEKAAVIERLGARGIDCRPFFHPLSSLPAYAHQPGAAVAQARNSVAYRICPLGINLPSGFNMDRQTVRRVTDALKAILADPRN